MKCLFLDYVQLLIIGRAGWWTQTPSATPLQPKNKMLVFGLRFNFWWSAGLVDETQIPVRHPSPAKKWNACFWITFNFWWSVNGLKPRLPPLSSQKNEMLVFGLCSTSDDWLGWSMDSNPICHPSPAKKIKCLFLDYISTSDDRPGWSMDINPIRHPSPAKKMKCSFSDYVQLLMIGQCTRTPSATPLQSKKLNACFWIMFNFWWSAGLVDRLQHHPPPLSSQKNKMLIFGLRSTSDDWPGWSMDINPIRHPSPVKKMKCLFLDYVQLLMISRAGWWTGTPSATLLQPIK